ncbi:unnamed protein product [Mucor hiemalis]
MISEHCIDDVREGPVVQEIIIYLGNLIRTQPHMFEGILRLRTHYIIIALREEISRVNHCDEEEAVEHLMQLSPFELKSLVSTVLSGPSLCHTSNNDVIVRDRSGGFLMFSNADTVEKKAENTNSYIPLLSEERNIQIKAQSGGYFSGNFAKVEINGIVMEANSRGIHVWAIDRKEHIILERASFDTHISEEESQEFSKFLNWLNNEMIVVIASKDEFIEHLTEDAILTLEQMGSMKIRQVHYRDSYVFIGEKGDRESVIEAHQLSTDGPTERIEKSINLECKQIQDRTVNVEINHDNIRNYFPSASGRWLRRRKNDGALNRVPSSNFFPQVWAILNRSEGLVIKGHVLPRDPIVLEKTPEEFNFAIAVESFLGWFTDPAERQVAIEVLTALHQGNVKSNAMIDLPMLISHAAQAFWKKWIDKNKLTKIAGESNDYDQNLDLARKLFFDLPMEGTESTGSYIKSSIMEVLHN